MEDGNNAFTLDNRGPTKRPALSATWRVAIEFGLIMLFSYTSLVMREFMRESGAQGKSLVAAIVDSFTLTNFCIGIGCALIGCLIVEFLLRRG
jgi:hypothetical protein